ncbi:MAG: AzlC family ABC transporter permease [Lachnospiraceae bacterium]|nr:AzlC family ABC transporter permease [Lachnospiraceae bacterium]
MGENRRNTAIKQIGYGIKDGLPIAIGYLSVAFSFGILAVEGGLSVAQATMISAFNTTSAGQVAGLSIMLMHGSLIEMAVTQFVINLRYSLMAISLSQNVNRGVKPIYRLLFGAMITDEVFAVAVSKVYKVGRGYLLGLQSVAFLGWALGTLLGAIMGGILPESVNSALGLAIYGMFIAIVMPKVRVDRRVSIVCIIAVVISCVFTYVPVINKVSGGFAVIIAAVTASLFGAFFLPDKSMPREKSVIDRKLNQKGVA